MKKIICLSACLFSIALTASVQAQVFSPVISLPGGDTVAPKKMLKISLNPLIQNASYNVSCTIADANKDSVFMRFDVLLNSPGVWGVFSLNGQELSNSRQGKLNQGNNKFLLTNVRSGGKGNNLTFQNLDLDESVSVSDCTATPTP
jgi:hypothetical protein